LAREARDRAASLRKNARLAEFLYPCRHESGAKALGSRRIDSSIAPTFAIPLILLTCGQLYSSWGNSWRSHICVVACGTHVIQPCCSKYVMKSPRTAHDKSGNVLIGEDTRQTLNRRATQKGCGEKQRARMTVFFDIVWDTLRYFYPTSDCVYIKVDERLHVCT